MAPSLNDRLHSRNRTGTLGRSKVTSDENAVSRHARQPSKALDASRSTAFAKSVSNRPVLNEVTKAAVNRKPEPVASKVPGKNGKEKDTIENLKRGRSGSVTLATGPQRVPLAQAQPTRARVQNVQATKPLVTRPQPIVHNPPPVLEKDDVEATMDVEEFSDEEDPSVIAQQREVEAMVQAHDSDEEHDRHDVHSFAKAHIWPEFSPKHADKYKREIDAIRAVFEDEQDVYDTTMVSEYAEEIFEYMSELEETFMPNPDYMDGQNDITWDMRQTLVDWLLQVHLRYHMLPETLWITINIIDRFLTKRVVSLAKLQLVGITAIFIASKYEEILAPGVEEFVYMTENGYTREEILKGERIILQTLDFNVSQYCSPYSWMRKISKADDYDIQTRTLSKFLTEATLLDHRFLRAKPSVIAAVGMYTARRMLGGDWNDSFVFYSGYTEEQLLPGHQMLVEKLNEQGFEKLYVFKKYANKKFLKAAVFAMEWARTHADDDEQMMF